MDYKKLINIFLIGLINLFSATCLTLLEPFYAKEATGRGLTVTQSGQVISIIVRVNIILTPLVTRLIPLVGARILLLAGCSICALGNIAHAGLVPIKDTQQFFLFSLLGRVVVGVGESAISATLYTIVNQQTGENDQGKVLGFTEACGGVGYMLGPCMGGFLYQEGGLALPFLVSGVALMCTGMLTAALLNSEGEESEASGGVKYSWAQVLQSDGVMVSLVLLVLGSSAYDWYAASLGPYLATYHGMTVGQTGLLLMGNALAYTVFTPVFGWLADQVLDCFHVQVVGNLIIFLSYLFLAPIPPLQALGVGKQVWVHAAAVFVQGVGCAGLYLGSLTHMMKGVKDKGEQGEGMVSSLWCVGHYIGAFGGASLGSWCYDMLGFARGTMVECVAILGITALVLGSHIKNKYKMNDIVEEDQEIETPLLHCVVEFDI